MTNYRALAVIPAFIGLLAAVTVVYILWQRKQTNGQLSLYRHPHNHHQQQPHQQPHQQQPNRPTQSQQQQHITQHHSTEQDDPSRLVWGLSPEEERTEEERRHLKSPLHQSAILQGTAQGQTGAPTPNHYRHPEIQAAKQQQHKGQKERKEQQEQQQEEEYTPQQQQAAKNIREAIPLTITPNHRQTTRVRKFIFESQSRDLSMYPNPNCYRVQLPRVLRNVIAIALQVAVIPKSEYNVNPYSQWLDIDEGGTIYQVQMPVGTYSLAAAINFPANLQASINAIPALAAYTVTYSNFTRKLTIDSNGAAFTMLFGTGPNRDNSLWQQMGFTRIDTTNAVSHVAPGVIDLNGVTAIDLFADELTPLLEGELAHIDLFPSDYTNYNPLDSGVRRYFWPIGKLGYLTFRFTTDYTVFNADNEFDVEHRLYDFNGREHSMRLEFVYREYRNILEDEVELDPPI